MRFRAARVARPPPCRTSPLAGQQRRDTHLLRICACRSVAAPQRKL